MSTLEGEESVFGELTASSVEAARPSSAYFQPARDVLPPSPVEKPPS
jgi:hypothetical protein